MSGVNMPPARDTSLTTTLLKGLQAAQAVMSIRADSAKLDQADRAEEDAKRKERGEFTAAEAAPLIAEGSISTTKTPNSVPISIGPPRQPKESGGIVDWVKGKMGMGEEPGTMAPDQPLQQYYLQTKTPVLSGRQPIQSKGLTRDNMTGTWTRIQNPNGTSEWLQEADSAPTVKTREVKTVENGKPVIKIVEDVAGSSFPVAAGSDPEDKANQRAAVVDKATAVKEIGELRKHLDTMDATSRKGIGIAQAKIDSSDRVRGLTGLSWSDVDAALSDPETAKRVIARLDQLSPPKKAEIANGLMNQITNGSGSLEQLRQLNPSTGSENIANLITYFKSAPQAANAGAMILDNLRTLKTERDISQEKIDAHNGDLVDKFPFAFTHADTKDKAEKMAKAFTKKAIEKPSEFSAPKPDTSGAALAAPSGPSAAEIAAELARRNVKVPGSK
jgi:hypothetical protein